METLFFLLLFFSGASLHSFFACFHYRRKHSLSLWLRSFCENCRSPLSALALIPVLGYFFYRARCVRCREPVSPAHPLGETLSGMVLIFCLWLPGEGSWLLPWKLGLALTLIYLSAEDFCDEAIHPIPLGLATALSLWVAGSAYGWGFQLLISPLVLTAAWTLLYFLYRGKLGLGDVFLSAAMGWLMPLDRIPLGILVASLGGLAYAWILKSQNRDLGPSKGFLEQRVPLVPFLIFGYLSVI